MATARTFSPADFSHNNLEYIPDPFPFYAGMRADSPAYRSESIFGGAWLFFRYADCLNLMTDERLSNARAAATGPTLIGSSAAMSLCRAPCAGVPEPVHRARLHLLRPDRRPQHG